jgi:hypothetical protein
MSSLLNSVLSAASNLLGSGADVAINLVSSTSVAGGVEGRIESIQRISSGILIKLMDDSTWTIGNLQGRCQCWSWQIGEQVTVVKNPNWISSSLAGGQHHYRICNGNTSAAADLNGGDDSGRYAKLLC